ncbi:MAG: PKD domain-containing protein, partial [Kiritimatiellia bacterium]
WQPGLVGGKVSGAFNVTDYPAATEIYLCPHAATNNSTAAGGVWHNCDNTTWVYTGQVYLASATTFAENIDDSVRLIVGGTQVLDNSAWNTPTYGTFTPPAPGWYSFELRMGNSGGGAGPVAGNGLGDGIGFGVKFGDDTAWSYMADDGNMSRYRHDDGLGFDDTFRVTGVPSNFGAPVPFYGTYAGVANGSNLTMSVASGSGYVTASDTQRACCTGYVWYAVDSVSSTKTVVQGGADTSFAYSHNNMAEIAWHWKVENLVTVTAGTGGSVSTNGGWLDAGATIEVTAIDGDAFFVCWLGDIDEAQRTSRTITITADQARTVTAHFGNEIFVSPAGDDSNSGGSPEQAFLTPAKALAVAADYDEIVLLAGEYQLAAELAISKAVTLRGVDRDTVILRAATGKRAVSISVADAVLSSVTVTDGSGNIKGANVYMTRASTVTNCVLRNGFSGDNGNGGAGIWLEAGLVTDSIITNNSITATLYAHTGGALHIKGSAVAERCLIAYNTAESRSDNPSHMAGPAGVLINSTTAIVRDCTIVENVAQAVGGIGFYAKGLVTNSIVCRNIAYRNAAPAGTYQGSHMFRNCALDAEGLHDATFTNYTGIIDFADPAAGDWRPRLTSIAYRDGDAAGAFKRLPASTPTCDLSAVVKAGLAPFDAAFVAATEAFGEATLSYTRHFGDGSAPLVTTTPSASHTYANPGYYTVSLYVTDGTHTASATYVSEVHVVAPVIHVTDVNPDAALPYDSWNCAATNLQTALDEAVDGCTILIDNVALPVRDATSVKVLKGVTIRSRNDDPLRAAIGRYGTTAKFRLLEINHADAVISGVALENGYMEETYGVGGNLRISKAGGTITNCVIRNGTMLNQGSGGAGIAMFAGRLTHSVVSNNYSRGHTDINHTGAIDLLGGVADNCLVTGNRSDGSKASYYPDVAGVNVAGGSLRNSTIVQNTAKTCGGVWIRNSTAGSVVNCIIAGNTSTGMPVPYNDFTGTHSLFSYCATTVEIPDAGAGCVHGNLPFVDSPNGDFTPSVGSVAIGNGLVQEWMATGRDLAGNPRLGDDAVVDIGAYERISSGLEASLTADSFSGAEPFTVSFTVNVEGATGAVSYEWDFTGTGADTVTTSTGHASFTYTEPGTYTPTVAVTDGQGNHTTA